MATWFFGTLATFGLSVKGKVLDPIINCRPMSKFSEYIRKTLDGKSFSISIFSDKDPITFKAVMEYFTNAKITNSLSYLTTNGQNNQTHTTILELGYEENIMEITVQLDSHQNVILSENHIPINEIPTRKFLIDINRKRLDNTGSIAIDRIDLKITPIVSKIEQETEEKNNNLDNYYANILKTLLNKWTYDYNLQLRQEIQLWTLTRDFTWYPMKSRIPLLAITQLTLETIIELKITNLLNLLISKKTLESTILLYGLPGNGKSTLIQCISTYLKQQVPSEISHIAGNQYIIHINTPGLSDVILYRLIDDVPKNSVIVIEDIDDIFSKSRANSLTEAGLTNILQGVGNVCNGKVVIMTTNYIDKISDRLKRIGRVNLLLEIKPPTEDIIHKYIEVNCQQNMKEQIGMSVIDHYNYSIKNNIPFSMADLKEFVNNRLNSSEN